MRIGNYILAVFFLTSFSFASNGQNKTIDSLKQILQTQKEDTNKVKTLLFLGKSLSDSARYDVALTYMQTAVALAEKINIKALKANAYNSIALIYQTIGKYNIARSYYLSVVKIWNEAAERSSKAMAIFQVSATYFTEGDNSEAIKTAYDALRIFEEINDKEGIAYTDLFLGYYLIEEGNYTETLKKCQLSKKVYEEQGSERFVAYCNLLEGRAQFKLGRKAEAFQKFTESLMVLERLNDFAKAEAHRYLGEYYEEVGKLKNDGSKENYLMALEHYMHNLNFWLISKDKGSLATAYNNIGRLSTALNDFSSAKKYLTGGLQIAKEIRSKGDIRNLYHSLSILDSTQGKFKEAFENHKLYILYRDSVSNEENKKKLLRTTMQYDFDKKEALAKTEQEKKDEAARRTRNLQYLAIGIVLLIAVFLFIYSRQKQKAKSKIEKAYSELKSTQQQLIQSEKMASLGELTAGIAHEIQNPLNFVNNFSEVNKELADELKGELATGNMQTAIEIADDIKANEEKINHHGKRADAIVKGMLQHSRNSSGQKEPTDINALADEYLRLAYHGMRAKDKSFNATTKTEFDNRIGKVNVVPQEIGRVILNLINNAFYAVNEKQKHYLNGYQPTVSVSTTKQNGNVEIKVKDNGIGIPQKNLDKIFQPFFTTKPTGQGTGLGLSLAYDIITKGHGGELKVETKEGEGSEFIIQLPS